nr:zinc finger, PMZ-type [Tanacetum cinerariifolium]
MSYANLRELVRKLVHAHVNSLYYCKVGKTLKQGLRPLQNGADVQEFLKAEYESKWVVDLYVEHHGYDPMDYKNSNAKDYESFDSSDAYCSRDDEEVMRDYVDFYHEGEQDVVVKNITTNDPFLTKLCSNNGNFRGTSKDGEESSRNYDVSPKELSKLEKDWAAAGIDNQFPIVQVNYRKLNVCILLNSDEGSREIEKMDFLLELCALHIDSSDMKLLKFLLVSDSKNHVEPNVAMDLSLQFSSSKWANEELISSRLKGTLLTDKRIPYLVVHFNNAVIQGNEASVADESLTFIIFETLLPCVRVPPIHFAAGIVYYITRGKYIMPKEVKRESKVVRWLVKWKWKWKKLYGRTMSLWKKAAGSLVPWGQGSFEEEGIVMRLTQVHSNADLTRTISKSVFVTNFPDNTTSADLCKICQTYGVVVDV